jgi:DNA repair exonuclease SbcCD nuclease subunit
MTQARIKLLCTADLHLGRRPSRLPEGADAARFSTTAAWDNLVREALAHQVDCLVLGGDLVDRGNRFFEAFAPLQQGIAKLAAAGIDTVAVSGNHDFDVLPRLHRQLAQSRFHLLGQGGDWQRLILERDSRPALCIDAWSFPFQHVAESPVSSYPFRPAEGVPTLGLVHGDLDQSASRYAPLPTASLVALPPDFWVVGHTHRGGLVPASAGHVLSPGSPQGLDPAENGWHGAWLVELASGTRPRVQALPVAALCYEELDLPATAIKGLPDLQSVVLAGIREKCLQLRETWPRLDMLSLRLRLSGHCPVPRHELEAALLGLSRDQTDILPEIDGVAVSLEQTEVATRPDIELETLALVDDLPGDLARMLLDLEAGRQSESLAQLAEMLRGERETLYRSAPFLPIHAIAGPAPASELELLRQEGWRLLSALLSQKESRT